MDQLIDKMIHHTDHSILEHGLHTML